jgi:hypothetical protein
VLHLTTSVISQGLCREIPPMARPAAQECIKACWRSIGLSRALAMGLSLVMAVVLLTDVLPVWSGVQTGDFPS